MNTPNIHFRKRLLKEYQENELQAQATVPDIRQPESEEPIRAAERLAKRMEDTFKKDAELKELKSNLLEKLAALKITVRLETPTRQVTINTQPGEVGFNLNDVPSTSTGNSFLALTKILQPLNPSEIKIEKKYPCISPHDPDFTVIGSNGTQVKTSELSQINWELPPSSITKKISMAVFGRHILATHSLTGRPSPAFKNIPKPEKYPLPEDKVADIIQIVTRKCNATVKQVRLAITSKCADESKMIRLRKKKNGETPTDEENIMQIEDSSQ